VLIRYYQTSLIDEETGTDDRRETGRYRVFRLSDPRTKGNNGGRDGPNYVSAFEMILRSALDRAGGWVDKQKTKGNPG
jgi:hypothetical protein